MVNYVDNYVIIFILLVAKLDTKRCNLYYFQLVTAIDDTCGTFLASSWGLKSIPQEVDMKTPSLGKRRTDQLPLGDKLRIVRGLIMGFEGQISFESGDGLIDGHFENPDNAHKAFKIIRRLLVNLVVNLIDERVISVRIGHDP